MTTADLKAFEDKTVIIQLVDGELATVKITFVDAEYEDESRHPRYEPPGDLQRAGELCIHDPGCGITPFTFSHKRLAN